MRSAALFTAALALLAPAARAGSDPAQLDYALAAEPETLDPHWAYDATSLFVADQLYETLVDFSGSALDAYEPRVASVVPSRENGFLSKDGLTYAFPLARGQKFHDGSPVTAEDAKYSLMRFLLLDRLDGPSSLLLEPLTGLHSTRDLEPERVFDLADKAVSVEGGALVLRLKKPFAPLLGVLANFGHIVSKKAVAAAGGWDGARSTWTRHRDPAREASALFARDAGSGPFRLARWDRSGKTLELERFEGYWRRPASLARARLAVIEDSGARRRGLAEGLYDVAFVERRYLDQFEGLPGVTVTDGLPALEVQNTLLFNFAVEPKDNPLIGSGRLDGQGVPPDFFADPEIRKAFAMSFDYDGYLAEAYKGKAIRALGPIPAGMFGYNARQRPWPFSREQAEAAFKRSRNGAVWERGFSVAVAYTEGRSDRRLACQTLKKGVEALNPRFRIDCRPLSQPKLLEDLRAKRLPAFVYRWILDYPDPHNAVEPFLHTRGFFASQLGYANPRADSIIEKAVVEPDPQIRKGLYGELQAMAIYDAPAIFTADSYALVVRRVKVANWPYHPIQPYGNLYEVTKLP
jgi:peptide/nickel transport system substrate-binding protein